VNPPQLPQAKNHKYQAPRIEKDPVMSVIWGESMRGPLRLSFSKEFLPLFLHAYALPSFIFPLPLHLRRDGVFSPAETGCQLLCQKFSTQFNWYESILSMNTLINSVSEPRPFDFVVSRKISLAQGQRLDFAANDKTVSGVVLRSRIAEQAEFVRVAVETEAEIPDHAKLSLPSRPDAGTCGIAFPLRKKNRVKLVLYIRCSCVDAATVE
jgi:hypothetical protein